MTRNEAEKAFQEILNKVTEHFPEYQAQLEPVPDSSHLRGLAVYGVPDSERDKVKRYASGLGSNYFYRTGYGLLVFVVDIDRTQAYYSDFIPSDHPCEAAFDRPEAENEWLQTTTPTEVKTAADDELALAA